MGRGFAMMTFFKFPVKKHSGKTVVESRCRSNINDLESLQIQMPNIVKLKSVSNSVVMTIKHCHPSPKSFIKCNTGIFKNNALSFFEPVKLRIQYASNVTYEMNQPFVVSLTVF